MSKREMIAGKTSIDALLKWAGVERAGGIRSVTVQATYNDVMTVTIEYLAKVETHEVKGGGSSDA